MAPSSRGRIPAHVHRDNLMVTGGNALTGNQLITGNLQVSGSLVGGSTSATPVGLLEARATAAGNVGLLIKGFAAQTGDLIRVTTSADAITYRVNKDGFSMSRKNAAPADADLSNGEGTWWLDATPGASKFMVKMKDSGGTVRTTAVALT